MKSLATAQDPAGQTSEKPRAYSYIRFSTRQQAHGDSLNRQKDKAARWAEEHGFILDTELTLTDAGVSAYAGRNARTGALAGFLEAVERGRVPKGSYLLIENIDRLSRDHVLEAQTIFSRIILAGITIVTLTNREVYSRERFNAEPHSILLIVLEQIRANQESVRKGQLVSDAKKRKKQQLIEEGVKDKPYTKQTPAWIRWDDEAKAYALIPERAAVVREIFQRCAAGHGIDRIAKDLNQRGVDTWGMSGGGGRKADHWRGSYMRKILQSAAPIGTFVPHVSTYDPVTRARRDEPLAAVEGMFPATVDEELYWRVNRRLATKAPRGKHAEREPKSIVAGLALCATCGHAMTRVSKGVYVYLVCSRANMRAAGCRYLAVPYSKVEDALKDNAKRLVAEAPRGMNTAALETQIARMQANADALENLTFDLAEELAREKSVAVRRRLSDAEAELRELRKTLRHLRAQRDTLATASVKARLKAVEEALRPGKSVRETNEVLREAIQRIAVDPEQGLLWIQWHHSEELQDVLCVTRHKRWGEDGEVRFVEPPAFMEGAPKE